MYQGLPSREKVSSGSKLNLPLFIDILNKAAGLFNEKLGMKDNDIIKRVNGQDLDSFEKATGLFTALRNEKTISIDLVRNGTRINYSYEIR